MGTLTVCFRDTPCGRLTEGPDGALRFQYLDAWIDEARFPVSIRLPLGPDAFGHDLVAPFVASFLPEGETLRRRLENLLHVDAGHDFGLLSVIGRESAGALSFWPDDVDPRDANPGYVPLTAEEFDRWRELANQLPLQFPGRTVRLSLAGAQSKTALYFDESDTPFLPQDGAPTTHILKPRIQGCRPSTVFAELLSMRIARSVLGEDAVPATDLWQSCYRVRRFDRPRTARGVERLHQEDFCLALGRMPAKKYESASLPERLLAPCFELIDELGGRGRIRSPALERSRLLDQVIINVLLHNPDAHLKNHAFLYQDDGLLEIAPLYDCLCTAGLAFEADRSVAWENAVGPAAHTKALSLLIGTAERIDEVDMAAWEAFAVECGFTRAFVRRRVKQLAEGVRENLRAVIDEVLEDAPAAEQAARGIASGVAGQLERTF